tara:strand:- start:4532 stop:5080 length:549 start_codon:yes stop_codon:yes gene_type:complete
MKTENIERYLNSFGKYIVQQSRTNLTKGKKNVDKSLYNSINFKVTTDANGFSVKFYMNNYGTFVDKGVSGNQETQSYKSYTGQTVSSPYKYKNKQPPTGIIEKWIKKRGLRGRVDKDWKSAGNKGGQFIKDKSFAFLIARKIKLKGIKSTSFFQRPMQLGLRKFGADLLKAIKEDVMKEFKQ